MSRVLTLLLVVGAALCFSAPTSARDLPPVYPGSEFRGFGAPAGEMIEVAVQGDIQSPGTYYLPKGSTLLDLLLRLGTCSGKGEFSPPRDVVVTSGTAASGYVRAKHSFFKVPADDLQKIPLVAGATYYIPHLVL